MVRVTHSCKVMHTRMTALADSPPLEMCAHNSPFRNCALKRAIFSSKEAVSTNMSRGSLMSKASSNVALLFSWASAGAFQGHE
eukprot:1810120-Pyramimonas_sp.AAC.1